jgi:hypothetical protein
MAVDGLKIDFAQHPSGGWEAQGHD